MLRSDWALDGTIQSHTEVHKQPDGRFKATVPLAPHLSAIGRDESEAINLIKQAIQDAHAKGELGN